MLSNWEEEGKMVVFSSTTNEWPQSQTIDEKISFVAPTNGSLMEKAASNLVQQQQQQQQHQHPSQLHGLKCPRCDSSNTKFCYYNNYSLSQPRHFCKACKRYWTRGGTLRNVPVGGGCRKNKRIKKQPSTSVEANIASTSTTANANPNPSTAAATTTTTTSRAQMDTISSGPSHLNPLFFGLPTDPSEMNNLHGYDLQPQLNSPGLGFPSNLLFGPSYSSPTMATLLASRFQEQHKFSAKGDSNKFPFDQFQTLTGQQPLDGLQVGGNNNESENILKGVKVENGQNRQMDWSLFYHHPEEHHHHHQLGFSSDPNSLYWGNGGGNNPSNNSVGVWHDPANLGPSVTSLI